MKRCQFMNHNEVDSYPRTARPQEFYSSYTTAMYQIITSFILLMNYIVLFNLLIVTMLIERVSSCAAVSPAYAQHRRLSALFITNQTVTGHSLGATGMFSNLKTPLRQRHC